MRAWRKFLAAVVKRYGRGGGYWTGAYPVAASERQSPSPSRAYQIWNEPNLPKFFPRKKTAQKYAKLVKIAHGAINGVDSSAKVVLAGLVGFANPRGWTFLNKLYRVRRIKRSFDVAALHPYAATIGQFGTEIKRIRRVMKRRHDGQHRAVADGGRMGVRPYTPAVSRSTRACEARSGCCGSRSSWFLTSEGHGMSSDCSGSTGVIPPAAMGGIAASAHPLGCSGTTKTPKPAYRAFRTFHQRRQLIAGALSISTARLLFGHQ